MNHRISLLQDYPFTRLRALTQGITPNPDKEPIALSLGEPKHAPPKFILDHLSDVQLLRRDLATYPATKGSEALRHAISRWVTNRFGTTVDADTEVLPVNGTREALFSFAQATLSGDSNWVMMPNPFYQIYEGAALLAGAKPLFINNDPANGYQQDFDSIADETWNKTELVYICSPGNPTGQVMPLAQMQQLIEKAHKFNFVIAADECYSEIFPEEDQQPHSLLNACQALGDNQYQRCVIFHSLSKRSNLPGLRSGFVAGDKKLLEAFLQYRTYHGCAMSAHHQSASALAWSDEQHVQDNRTLYRQKFSEVEAVLAPSIQLNKSDGGFYHWLPTPISDTEFSRRLLEQQNVSVLPGSYLARSVNGVNPGENHVRVAWVSPLENCREGAERIRSFISTIT